MREGEAEPVELGSPPVYVSINDQSTQRGTGVPATGRRAEGGWGYGAVANEDGHVGSKRWMVEMGRGWLVARRLSTRRGEEPAGVGR